MNELVEKVKATRTTWLQQHGIPISHEFAEFAEAVGNLCNWAEARTQSAGPGWISVEEKLPECAGEYLIVEIGDRESSTADYYAGEWKTVRSFGQDSENRELYNVTHWMPLPGPPASEAPPTYWCCKADFGQHEPTCKSMAPPPQPQEKKS